MKAYVINQNQLKQYIVIGIIALALSFLFGYIIGGSQNELAKIDLENTIESTPAESSSLLEKQTDAQALTNNNDNKAEQKNIKEAQAEDKKQAKKKPTQKNKVATKAAVKNKPDNKTAAIIKKNPVEQKKVVEKVKVSTAEINASTKSADVAEIKSTQAKVSSDTLARDNEQVDSKRLYSIQVGMFASKNNADSFIEKLAVEKFEAYVSDFVSTSGAVKYNVRVGRFDERDKAREKLKEYQKFFSTPAYVVIGQ